MRFDYQYQRPQEYGFPLVSGLHPNSFEINCKYDPERQAMQITLVDYQQRQQVIRLPRKEAMKMALKMLEMM